MVSVIDRAPSQPSRVQVGIVDCDTHNYWESWDELYPYLASRWPEYIETFGARKFPGNDYPRFWTSPADRRPPSGRKAGADVGFMGSGHLDKYNIAYAMLIPLTEVSAGAPNLEFSVALASAVNDWQVARWLEPEPRLRASLVIASEDADAAVAEIRRMAPDKRFVQIMFSGRSQEPMGRRRYWPIYEACEEFGLPVMSHAFGATGNPITGAGWPSYYLEDHVGPPQAMQTNVTSMVMEGVFERFPTLKLVSVENGFGWAPSLMWRMDNAWKALGSEVPHVTRPPSEYVAEHVYYATQPVEEPEKRQYFQHLLDQYPAFVDKLVFSSDYPHWDGDAPDRAVPLLRDAGIRDKVLRHNARLLYGLS